MDGGNLVKMVNPPDKEIEILEDREIHNQLNDTTPKKRSNDGSVPCEGMKFTSLEEFEKYYYAYAFSKEFTVRVKKTLKFDRTNIVRYRQYVCSCAGFCDAKQKLNDEVDENEERKRRKTLTRRSGCPVTITMSKNKGVWKVKTVNNKHNHLLVSPNSRTHLRQHGSIPSIAKKLIEKFSESDLPIGKVPAILNCDAEINKQVQDANFYYDIQTDDEDSLVNFFWIDSTARQYYERFGDVGVFDTTYQTNKYNMPLENFVSVNNHSQSIMFGCALLQNEEEETFVWLFQTWLEALSGKLPVSILTDQDHAIKNAIDKVFPTVTHRFCLWHILKKFPEKHRSIYKENSPFSRELQNFLGSGIQPYHILCRYITQRCESIHSFFDSFLNKGTTLREFVVKYERAIEHRYIAEHAERFVSIYKKPNFDVRSSIEEQAANVYTRNIFSKFQDELEESFKLMRKKLPKNGSSTQYKVSNFRNPHEEFLVIINVESKEVSCECHLFEFQGILCRHILDIYNKKGVAEIPPRYILSRWTKRAAEGIHIPLYKKDGDAIARDVQFNSTMSWLRPYLHVSGEAFDTIMKDLDMMIEKFSNMQVPKEEIATVAATEENAKDARHPLLGDPHISKTKGRKKGSVESKNGRLRGGFEVAIEQSKKSKRRCKDCGEVGHNVSTCERRKQAKAVELVP
ncbi:protein FAR1-RELATED SEQUENCE 5-like [Carex rostrata]